MTSSGILKHIGADYAKFFQNIFSPDPESLDDMFLEFLGEITLAVKTYCIQYPLFNQEGLRIKAAAKTESDEVYLQRWNDILDQIIILSDEAMKSRCSMQNPYRFQMEAIKHRVAREYPDEYVMSYIHGHSETNPDCAEFVEIWRKSLSFQDEIRKYRRDCRRQLMELLKKHFLSYNVPRNH